MLKIGGENLPGKHGRIGRLKGPNVLTPVFPDGWLFVEVPGCLVVGIKKANRHIDPESVFCQIKGKKMFKRQGHKGVKGISKNVIQIMNCEI